jgi:hypothetical protein
MGLRHSVRRPGQQNEASCTLCVNYGLETRDIMNHSLGD